MNYAMALLSAERAVPPALAIVQWLLVPGGLVLVLVPLFGQWWFTQAQTRGPRARVAAIRNATETLALLDKDSDGYLAVDAQRRAEVADLLAVVNAVGGFETVVAAPDPRRNTLSSNERRALRRNRWAAWVSGAGAAVGLVLFFIGASESFGTGETSWNGVIGTFLFTFGGGASFAFSATAHSISEAVRQRPSRTAHQGRPS